MAMNRAIQTVVLLILLVSSSSAGETTMFFTPPSSLWHDSPDMLVPDFDIQKIMGYDQDTRNDVTVNLYLFAQQMAKFKMNRLIIHSPIFFFLKYETTTDDNDPDVPAEKRHWSYADYFAEFFDYCRSLHIEPIPSLDYQPALLRHNGNCLEYSIFDTNYIEENNIRPGEGDYQGMPDYYQNYEDYPYPMPQPSWEFTLEKENIDGEAYPPYYFADHTVSVWVIGPGGGQYQDVKTMDYRVYNQEDFPVRVEMWNEQEQRWDLLNSGYTLHNVGLNDGNTSYYRFMYAGLYGDEKGYWAYITFNNDIPEGTQIRVSYAAPINMSLILPNSFWASSNPLSQRFSMYTCLSHFDQNPHPNPPTDDITDNWTTWDSRDIWYVALYEMIDWLKPRYIDIQHCEMWVMHTDYRCREERKTSEEEPYPAQMQAWEHNAWNYGHEIEFVRKTIADLDDDLGGNAQMMLYADMLDSHNGRYAEGRCGWNWYPNYDRDAYPQPDSDDTWVGNVASHIYYQPAMGGMGGWTWDEREDPDGLDCIYGMMASDYITEKDSILCREWGYQAGYFDDRDPEHVITWQEKFKERYNNLKDQGFTNFVGDCAGYALGLEGGYWGGIRFRCRDELAGKEGVAGIGGNNSNFKQLDGTNLKWVQMNYYLSGLQEEPGLDIHMYLEAYNLDPTYAGTYHIDPNYGTGCHLGMVQDGCGYADDVHVVMNDTYDLTPDIYNSLFEYSFPNEGDPHGEHNWTPTINLYDSWLLDDYHPNTGSHCCKFSMNHKLYEYSSELYEKTFNERRYGDPNKQPNSLNFSVYLRTLKLDALRHLNIKSWMDLTYNYQPQDKILGMINTQWGEVRNYSSESTSADWMWFRNYPASPLIKYMYYDPFYMFMGDRATHPDDTYPPNAPYPRDTESWTEP